MKLWRRRSAAQQVAPNWAPGSARQGSAALAWGSRLAAAEASFPSSASSAQGLCHSTGLYLEPEFQNYFSMPTMHDVTAARLGWRLGGHRGLLPEFCRLNPGHVRHQRYYLREQFFLNRKQSRCLASRCNCAWTAKLG